MKSTHCLGGKGIPRIVTVFTKWRVLKPETKVLVVELKDKQGNLVKRLGFGD